MMCNGSFSGEEKEQRVTVQHCDSGNSIVHSRQKLLNIGMILQYTTCLWMVTLMAFNLTFEMH
eukprot:scaffold68_cov163-Skeletonema_marinoi.AAC.1